MLQTTEFQRVIIKIESETTTMKINN